MTPNIQALSHFYDLLFQAHNLGMDQEQIDRIAQADALGQKVCIRGHINSFTVQAGTVLRLGSSSEKAYLAKNTTQVVDRRAIVTIAGRRYAYAKVTPEFFGGDWNGALIPLTEGSK